MEPWMGNWLDIAKELEAGTPSQFTLARANRLLRSETGAVEEVLQTVTGAIEMNSDIRKSLQSSLGRITILEHQLKGRRDRKAVDMRRELRELRETQLTLYAESQARGDSMNDLAIRALGAQGTIREIIRNIRGAEWTEAATRLKDYVTEGEAWVKRHFVNGEYRAG